MPAISIVVQGRVQGVGFRAHAAHAAAMLGVCGSVWNRRDGAVEIVAAHPSQAVLDAFVDKMRAGPGRVDHLWTDTLGPEVAPQGFSIAPTR